MEITQTENVVICGAGPAGCAASFFLSKNKVPHTIIDKAVFPRDKICGDAVSGKVLDLLKKLNTDWLNELKTQVDHTVITKGIRFVAPNGKSLSMPFPLNESGEAPGFVSKRIAFDDFLFNKLESPYANIISGARLLNIEKIAGQSPYCRLEIQTEERQSKFIKSSLVIAADGAGSIVRRKLHTDSAINLCAGIRAYYKGVEGMDENHFIELHYIKKLLPGYFWIFPLGNGHCNVGLGMFADAVKKRNINLRKLLPELIEASESLKARFKNAELTDDIKGWSLPMFNGKKEISGENYLLSGDAASLIDPFTGEGIGNAMWSGYYAAQTAMDAISENDFSKVKLCNYDLAVYQHLYRELNLSSRLQKLSAYPFLFNFVINKASKNKKIQDLFINMFTDLSIREKMKNPLFYFKLLFNR